MAGYDDPRFLQQKIEKLEKDLAHLTKSTLPLASQQRGPIPGFMRAVQINDVGQKGSMWMNFTNIGPGFGPYSAVTDNSGTIRAEWGNLAANGVSPAQFGFRASDANGVPINDSVGLSQVMQQLGRGDNTNGQNFTTTTPTVCTGTSATFTLVRAVRVLALMAVLGNAATQTGKMDMFLDGSDLATPASNGASALAWYGIGGPTVTSGNFYSATLSAGSHTFDLRGYVNATPATFFCTGATLIVYSLGT